MAMIPDIDPVSKPKTFRRRRKRRTTVRWKPRRVGGREREGRESELDSHGFLRKQRTLEGQIGREEEREGQRVGRGWRGSWMKREGRKCKANLRSRWPSSRNRLGFRLQFQKVLLPRRERSKCGRERGQFAKRRRKRGENEVANALSSSKLGRIGRDSPLISLGEWVGWCDWVS